MSSISMAIVFATRSRPHWDLQKRNWRRDANEIGNMGSQKRSFNQEPRDSDFAGWALIGSPSCCTVNNEFGIQKLIRLMYSKSYQYRFSFSFPL